MEYIVLWGIAKPMFLPTPEDVHRNSYKRLGGNPPDYFRLEVDIPVNILIQK